MKELKIYIELVKKAKEKYEVPETARYLQGELMKLIIGRLQECVNDMGITDDSAPYITFALEVIADNLKSMETFNKAAYDEINKQFANIRYTDTIENEDGGFEGMNFRNKKSSDGDIENHTSEDK